MNKRLFSALTVSKGEWKPILYVFSLIINERLYFLVKRHYLLTFHKLQLISIYYIIKLGRINYCPKYIK